jgi:hypothetical protein
VRVGAGERRAEATEVLLRDLVFIPDEVHAGDFVLALSEGVSKESTIADYVVTEQLAVCFDRALGLIKSGGRDLVIPGRLPRWIVRFW